MRVAVTGVTGRLGGALLRCLNQRGHQVLPLDRQALDLARPERVRDHLQAHTFDALINPAAMTSLETCEDSPEIARAVNALSPECLAAHCAEAGKLPFST